MLSQLEQACKTYSTESSSGLIEFDSNWQRIFVTALTFHLDQAIEYVYLLNHLPVYVFMCVFSQIDIFRQCIKMYYPCVCICVFS